VLFDVPVGVAHTALGKFDDLLSYYPRSRLIGQFHPEFLADDFERERHLPNQFRLKSLACEKWSYRHGMSHKSILVNPIPGHRFIFRKSIAQAT